MGKAKTASKNNPNARAKAKDIMYNGQKVKPAKFLSMGRNFMAVQYEGGQMAFDADGNPVPWAKIGV